MDELEKKIFTRFKRLAQQERDQFLHQMEEEMDELMDEVKSTTKSASSFLSQAPLTLYKVNSATLTSVPVGSEKLSSALADLNKELSQAAQKAYTKEKIFYEQLKAYVETGIEESQEAVHKAMDEASHALNDAVADIKEGVDEVMMKVEDIVDQIQNEVNAVIDEAKNAFEEFKQALKDAINQVLDALDDLWHQIEDLFRNGLSLDNLHFDFSLFDSFPDTDNEVEEEDEEDEEEEKEDEEDEEDEVDMETFVFDDPLVITASPPNESSKKNKDNKSNKKENKTEESHEYDGLNMSTDSPFTPGVSSDNFTSASTPASTENPDLTLFNGSLGAAQAAVYLLGKLAPATKLGKIAPFAGLVINGIGFELTEVLELLDKAGYTGEIKPFLRQYLGDIVDTPEFDEFMKAPRNPKDLSEALNRGGDFLDKYMEFFADSDAYTIFKNSGNIVKDSTAALGDLVSGVYNSGSVIGVSVATGIAETAGDLIGVDPQTMDVMKTGAKLAAQGVGALGDYLVTSTGDVIGSIANLGLDLLP